MANRAEGVAEVIINDQQAQNSLKSLAEQAAKLNDQLNEMRKANDKLGYDKTKKELDAVNKEMQSYKKTTFDMQKVLNNLSGSSYNDLLKVQKQLRNEMKGMKRDTEEQIKLYNQKKEAVAKVDKELTKLQGDMKMGGAEFSKYAGTMTQSLQQMGVPVGPLQAAIMKLTAAKQALTASQAQFTTATTASTAATGVFSGALKILRIALISTGIGAIAVALGALAAAFFTTQRGTDALNKVLIPLRTIFERLLGIIQELGWRIIDAFKDPKAAISDLWEFLKSQIVNRIEGVKNMFIGLGKVISSALKFDWDGVKEGAVDFGEAYVQTLTGVEDAIEKAGDAIKGFVDEVKTATDEGDRLAALKIEMEELAIVIARNEGRIGREIMEQYMVLSDVNNKENERIEAGKKAIAASEEMLALKTKELDLQIEEMQLRLKQNDTDRVAQLELARLEDSRNGLKRSQLQSIRRIQNQLNSLLKGENTEREKSLETQIKAEEAQKKALDDYYNELNKLADENFQKSLTRDQQELLRIDQKYEALYAKAQAANQTTDELQLLHAEELAAKEKEIEERLQNELLAIRKQYKLVDQDELMELEIAQLIQHNEILLLTEEDLQSQIQEIRDRYAQKKADKDQAAADLSAKITQDELNKKIEKYQKYADLVLGVTGSITTFQQAAMNRELAAAGDNEEKKEQIRKEYARKQQLMAAVEAVVQGALGIVKTGANLGYPLAIPFQIVQGLQTIAQIALIKSQQFAAGKYDVIGGSDGRTYRAGMVPQAATGIYPEPTLIGGLGLVGERAPELVVDGPTLKNIQMNAPEIIQAIHAMRVPQYDTGRYQAAPPAAAYPSITGMDNSSAQTMIAILNEILAENKKLIRAKIVYTDLEDTNNEIDQIKNDVKK